MIWGACCGSPICPKSVSKGSMTSRDYRTIGVDQDEGRNATDWIGLVGCFEGLLRHMIELVCNTNESLQLSASFEFARVSH